jgi:hypothetical protein
VNQVEKPRSKSPVVPRLNHEAFKRSNNENMRVATTYNTRESKPSYRVQKTPTHDFNTNNTFIVSDTGRDGETSRFDTNMMISRSHATPNIERSRRVVQKSPLRSPMPSKYVSKIPDLTESSPNKYYAGTTNNYIPGT